jgi:hypothetical protein
MFWITVSWKSLPGTNTLAYYLIMLPNDTTQTYMNIYRGQNPSLFSPAGKDVVMLSVAAPKKSWLCNFVFLLLSIGEGFHFFRNFSMVHHPQNGITNPKYKLLHFLTTKIKFCKEKKALAFNRDRCCHLVLCSRLILFHYFWS